MSEMDHSLLDERLVAERYVTGRLPAAERVEFEEHFLDCPACLDRIEAIEGLRDGLRELAPGARAAGREPAVLRFPARRALGWAAAAGLAAAFVAAAFFRGAYRRTSDELAGARQALETARREGSALEAALGKERAARAAAAGAAVVTASVFPLNVTRSAGAESPANRVVLGGPGEWVVVLLDRPAAGRFESYRARISAADGRVVADALTARGARGETLAVGLPPGVLAPGDYALALEGVTGGRPTELATLRFRAVPKP